MHQADRYQIVVDNLIFANSFDEIKPPQGTNDWNPDKNEELWVVWVLMMRAETWWRIWHFKVLIAYITYWYCGGNLIKKCPGNFFTTKLKRKNIYIYIFFGIVTLFSWNIAHFCPNSCYSNVKQTHAHYFNAAVEKWFSLDTMISYLNQHKWNSIL